MGWLSELNTRLPFWMIMGFKPTVSNPDKDKPMHSALLGYDQDWLAQCQGDETEWDIMSVRMEFGLPV